MAVKLLRFTSHNVIGVLRRVVSIITRSLLRPIDHLSLMMFLNFGYWPDLRNPKTLNEKIQWRKLFDRNPLFPIVTDKYCVRGYVKKKIGESVLPELYHVTGVPGSIPFEKLPDRFVIKANVGSGNSSNIFIEDKSTVNERDIIKKCKRFLQTKSNNWFHQSVPRKILVEEFLPVLKGELPTDYKFFVFNGKVEIVLVITERHSGDPELSLFSKDWEYLNLSYGLPNKRFKQGGNKKRPYKLEQMIKYAEQLGEDFDFIRVDMYCIENRIWFGELTVQSGGGFILWEPRSFDKFLGDLWKIKN